MTGMFRKFTLKRKIIAIILLTSGIVLLLSSAALTLREGVSFWKEEQEKLAVLADVIGSNASAPILFDDRQAAAETLRGLGANPHIMAAYILTEDGRVFAEYHHASNRGDSSTALSTPPETMLRETGHGSFRDWGSALKTAKPISYDGQLIGSVIIQSDTVELSSRLKWFLYVFGVIAMVVLPIAYYISSRLQGIISGPILELAGAMKTISNDKTYSFRARKEYDDEIGILIDGFNEMLTEIEERNEKLAYLAHFDTLTLLPNRVMFQDRLSQALHLASRASQQVAILFIDLDDFKDVNDTYGHRFGDLLLKKVAERLRAHIRLSDTIARLGGDEFVIFIQNVGTTEHVIGIAEKLAECLSPRFAIEGTEVFVAASIGISLFPADGKSVEELVKNSDAAMYHAKKTQGKNCFRFFSPQMHEEASKRLTMINSLRHALENDEFLIHYQPKIEISSGRVTGMESLLRWRHPEQGIVLPNHFIPLAEESGLIIPIGEWVLRAVCRQIKEWLGAGLSVPPVAVNVSACQFRSLNIEATVAGILEETGVNPACLELELTESAIMHNVEDAMKTLSAMKSMGVKISIDDFGTGYSSLAYLKRFTIDSIKIDRSFVMNIPESRDDNAIVIAIIAMALSLNLKLIAEGVETEGQLSFLEREGCHEMQGYLCSRPVPPDQFVAFLQDGAWRKAPG